MGIRIQSGCQTCGSGQAGTQATALSCDAHQIDGDDIIVEVTVEAPTSPDVLFTLYLGTDSVRTTQREVGVGPETLLVRFTGAAGLVSAGTYQVGIDATDTMGFSIGPESLVQCGEIAIGDGGNGNGGNGDNGDNGGNGGNGDGGCSFDDDCPTGQRCIQGDCVETTGCNSDFDCSGDLVCVNGACVEPGDGNGGNGGGNGGFTIGTPALIGSGVIATGLVTGAALISRNRQRRPPRQGGS